MKLKKFLFLNDYKAEGQKIMVFKLENFDVFQSKIKNIGK